MAFLLFTVITSAITSDEIGSAIVLIYSWWVQVIVALIAIVSGWLLLRKIDFNKESGK